MKVKLFCQTGLCVIVMLSFSLLVSCGESDNGVDDVGSTDIIEGDNGVNTDDIPLVGQWDNCRHSNSETSDISYSDYEFYSDGTFHVKPDSIDCTYVGVWELVGNTIVSRWTGGYGSSEYCDEGSTEVSTANIVINDGGFVIIQSLAGTTFYTTCD